MGDIYVGTSGWSYPDWVGIVYPKAEGKLNELEYLSRYFDAVEINTTFYRPPNPKYCQKWLLDVKGNPRFKFTAKLWQRFTHERTEKWRPEEAKLFKNAIEPLHESGKLGALLIQFPWAFPQTDESRAWLQGLAEAFNECPLVVEVRHVSWQNDEGMDFFRGFNLNFCNIDQPVTRSSIGPTSVATGPVGYYRFHGRNREAWFKRDAGRDERYNYLYSDRELSPWVEQVRAMQGQVRELYLMMNNHFKGQAPANALEILAALLEKPVPVPPPLVEAFSRLAKIQAPYQQVGSGQAPAPPKKPDALFS
jgi:uncharacterized protein YecE (DUF72 family)